MTDWKWYAGQGGEHFSIGPCDTREAAIEDGREEYNGEAFDICEAKQDPLKLSDWIDVERMVEDADDRLEGNDRVCYEFDEAPYFPHTLEQANDLRERVKRACDEWQAAHGLVFKVSTFSASRSHETIPEIENAEAAE